MPFLRRRRGVAAPGAGGSHGDATEGTRVVSANASLMRTPGEGFCDNSIITSKYTWFNIVPRAIWEQFRRLSNVYFLFIAVVSFFRTISPVSPATTVLPLVVVVGFGMARDVWEDFGRKKQDRRGNNAPVEVLVVQADAPGRGPDPAAAAAASTAGGGRRRAASPPWDGMEESDQLSPPLVKRPSRTLRVGDVVRIRANEIFPADMIPLLVSNEGGIAYCSTANLDGESSLKRRLVPSDIYARAPDGPGQLYALLQTLTVHASKPNTSLYDFAASFSVSSEDEDAHHSLVPPNNGMDIPLDSKNLVLRGSVLRNTAEMYALVVYTGKDTKVALNMRDPPSKLGQIEIMMNHVVIVLFIALLLLTGALALLAGLWQSSRGKSHWYMGDLRNLSGSTAGLRGLGTFIILFHTFIPISMFVTLEFVRVIQGIFIYADVKMRSRGLAVVPKAGNLHEVLGNIEHILSDKTGTLTQNVMRFVACSTGGKIYDIRKQKRGLYDAVRQNAPSSAAYQLVLAMSLTHDVVPERVVVDQELQTTAVEFLGQSPDEVALVGAASDLGIALKERRLGSLVLETFDRPGQGLHYALLAELEFSSDRKRMSVLIRDETTGNMHVFTKGADSVMMELMERGPYESDLKAHIMSFAVSGLRTLIYASRQIGRREFDQWSEEWTQASNLLDGRSERQAALAAQLEVNLNYLGCTAVEDKLQDRVPETIQFLRDAGVRIWVLTGDKLETAENIGYSANLLNRSMHVEVISAPTVDSMRERLLAVSARSSDRPARRRSSSSFLQRVASNRSSSSLGQGRSQDISVVIDGSNLALIEGNDEMEKLFMDVSDVCKTVICARVTPSQKAKMVQMLRRWRNSVTLAIGDGGNDVAMIQEAHVGVGIVGNEGTQAALASDYSIPEFRHLQRLMTVHGRYSYIRSAGVINLSLYKNIVFTTTQILFQLYDFATGTTFQNEWINTLFNAIITLLGPFLYGIFERDLEESTLERYPSVYLSNRNNRLFSYATVGEHTIAYSMWHGAVIYYGAFFLLGRDHEIALHSGRDLGFSAVGLAVSILVVAVVQFKFLMSSHVLNAFVLAGILLSFGSLFAFVPLFISLLHKYDLEGVLSVLFASARFHLLWPVIFVIAFFPDFIVVVHRAGLLLSRKKENTVSRLQRQEVRERMSQGRFGKFRARRREAA
jgi:phospholipid-transporting ATPase